MRATFPGSSWGIRFARKSSLAACLLRESRFCRSDGFKDAMADSHMAQRRVSHDAAVKAPLRGRAVAEDKGIAGANNRYPFLLGVR